MTSGPPPLPFELLHKRFGAAVVRNLRHLQPFFFERGKVLGFVRVAFLLDQERRLVVLRRAASGVTRSISPALRHARIRGNPTRSEAEKRVVPARICMVASPARAGRRVEGEGCNDSRYALAQAFHASRCRASLPNLRRRRRSQIRQSGTLHIKRASSARNGDDAASRSESAASSRPSIVPASSENSPSRTNSSAPCG